MTDTTKTRRAAKGRLTRKVHNFTQLLSDGEPTTVIKMKFEEVKEAWANLEEKHDAYMSELDEWDAREDEWITESQQEYNTVAKLYATMQQTDGVYKEETTSAQRLQLEQTKLPRFSGDIRDYAHFKTDFKAYVEPHVPVSIVAYTLKSCLCHEAAHKVRNEDAISDMWRVLDDKYADAATVADVIMDDINKTKPFNNQEIQRFIKFVDDIEDSYYDLRKLGLEKELTTTCSVSIIETKLSPEMQIQWSRVVVNDPTVNQADKFPSLLKFLRHQKRAMEYRCARIRTNHTGEPREGIARVHHINASTVREVSTVEHINTQAENRKCLIHLDSDHRTCDCGEYASKSVDQRLDLLKQKGGCWSCLKRGHRFHECTKKTVCGENGCHKRHHRSLHIPEVNIYGTASHVYGCQVRDVTAQIRANMQERELTNAMQIQAPSKETEEIHVLKDELKKQSCIHEQKMNEMQLEINNVKDSNRQLLKEMATLYGNRATVPQDLSRTKLATETIQPAIEKLTTENPKPTTGTSDNLNQAAAYSPHARTPAYHGTAYRSRWNAPFMYQTFLCTMLLATIVNSASACEYNSCLIGYVGLNYSNSIAVVDFSEENCTVNDKSNTEQLHCLLSQTKLLMSVILLWWRVFR